MLSVSWWKQHLWKSIRTYIHRYRWRFAYPTVALPTTWVLLPITFLGEKKTRWGDTWKLLYLYPDTVLLLGCLWQVTCAFTARLTSDNRRSYHQLISMYVRACTGFQSRVRVRKTPTQVQHGSDFSSKKGYVKLGGCECVYSPVPPQYSHYTRGQWQRCAESDFISTRTSGRNSSKHEWRCVCVAKVPWNHNEAVETNTRQCVSQTLILRSSYFPGVCGWVEQSPINMPDISTERINIADYIMW